MALIRHKDFEQFRPVDETLAALAIDAAICLLILVIAVLALPMAD